MLKLLVILLLCNYSYAFPKFINDLEEYCLLLPLLPPFSISNSIHQYFDPFLKIDYFFNSKRVKQSFVFLLEVNMYDLVRFSRVNVLS